jgi:hypothetical protein
MEATSDGETIIDDLVIGDVHSMEKLTHLQKPTIKKSRKVMKVDKINNEVFISSIHLNTKEMESYCLTKIFYLIG